MRLLAIVLLALPQTMRSQSYEGAISKAFEKVLSTKGVNHSTIREEHRESTGGVEEKTIIHNITVGRANFKIFDELKNAFLTDEEFKTNIYTCFGPLDDSYRLPCVVKLKRGGDFRVGQKSGSSYAIATFDDPQRQGYRLVYTAEWWDTDDKDIRQGVLLSSYGEKPAIHSHSAQADWSGKLRSLESRMQGEKSLLQGTDWAALRQQWPSLASADSLMKVYFPDNKADFTTDPNGWMRQAISHASNLDESDWLRLFGMLTQKMIDRADRESVDDLVVAAGIILDMCKETTDLDKDEKDICAARLKEVATQVQSRSQYVHDLLLLAAKRLQKKP